MRQAIGSHAQKESQRILMYERKEKKDERPSLSKNISTVSFPINMSRSSRLTRLKAESETELLSIVCLNFIEI